MKADFKWLIGGNKLILWIFLLVFIAFNGFFVESFNTLFVNTFLKHCKSSLTNDLLFILTFVFFCLLYIKKIANNFQTSKSFSITIIVISLCYLYYRLTGTWSFTEFSLWNWLKYFDLLFAITFWQVFLSIANLTAKPSDKALSPNSFILDEPIEDFVEDDLQRIELAKHVVKRVEATNGKLSFAISITAKWGFGKTSFLNLVKQSIENKNKTIVIDFNPWLSLDKGSLLQSFFESISSKIESDSRVLPNLIREYGRLIITHDKSIISRIYDDIVSLFDEPQTTEDSIKKINDALVRMDKQVFIFIDDLDRLQSSEIISLLQLIRNSANFSNFKFIAAFDRDYVLKAIETKLNKHNYYNYLEKIFVTEISLPPISRNKIKDGIYNEVLKFYPDKAEEINKAFNTSPFNEQEANLDAIQSLRDVKRFLNDFISSYDEIKNEVYFKDIFVFEILRYKFPSIYDLIITKREWFLDVEREGSGKEAYYKLSKSKNVVGADEFAIAQHLISNFQELNIKGSEIPVIMSILKNLFYESSYRGAGDFHFKTIALPENFHKYSLHQLIASDLSNTEFDEGYRQSLEVFKKSIYYWIKDGKKSAFLKRMFRKKNVDFKSRDEFEKYILALIYAEKVEEVNRKGYYGFSIDSELGYRLNDDSDVISKQFYEGKKEEFISFVRKIFNESEFPHFLESELVQSIISQWHGSFILTDDELENIVVKYFSIYLNSISKMNSEVWGFYHNCKLRVKVPMVGTSYQIHKKASIKANDLFKEFISQKDADGFFYAIIEVEPFDQKLFRLSSVVPEIFDSYNDFGTFLKSGQIKNSVYLMEFTRFFDSLSEYHFSRYVPFIFEIIPPKARR